MPASSTVQLLLASFVWAAHGFSPSSSFFRVGRTRVFSDPEGVQSTGFGSGKSLDYNPEKYSVGTENFRQLSGALREADEERKKAEQEKWDAENVMLKERLETERKIKFMNDMPDDTPAGFVKDYMYKSGVADVLQQLDYDLVGLKDVKKRVNEIACLLVIDKMRRKLGFDTTMPSLHMCFTGSPGTGKTTVAIRLGQILQKMGYIRSGHVVIATRDDLVGQYVGHTAPKTKEVVEKALGGVLFIDEAYYLYNAANERDYGQESIEILLNVMETKSDDLVVVYAGYKDRMEKFFSYIPGMYSRIGNHIEFPNYDTEELISIAEVMVRDMDYVMGPGAREAFRKYIELRRQMPFFSNARTVRNAMDRARMNMAYRLFERAMEGEKDGTPEPETTNKDLMTISEEDFLVLLREIQEGPKNAIAA